MEGFKKSLSIFLVLTLTFTGIIFPSVTQAAPPVLPPINPVLPAGNVLKPIKTMESPSTISGMNYKFDPKVINLPAQPYSLVDIPESAEPSAPSVGLPALPGLGVIPPSTGEPSPKLQVPTGGRELPDNAKNLVVNKGALDPKLGEIYFDPNTNGAFKVVGKASTDSLGRVAIPVIKPEMQEVLQKFNVPNQTIKLTDGNIDPSSLGEGVEYVGMQSKSTAMASNDGGKSSLSAEKEGNTYIFKLKNFTIYEYPSPKSPEEQEEAKKRQKIKDEEIRQAKENGTYDYLANYEWTDAKNKSSVGVKIKVSEGILKVTDPKINFDADWDTLVSPIGKAHCDIDMKIDSNVTIDGNIKLKEERWQQIYGYLVCDNQSNPKVRIYIGVFAVIGLEGELSFKVKVKQVGELHHGIDMYFSSGVPLGVIPSGSFDPQSQSVGIVIDGKIKATAGVMAGLGIEIFEFNVVQLQIRLGLEGDCTFHVEAGDTSGMKGGGNAPSGGAYASATFQLYFFVGVNAAVVGIDIPIFNKKFLLVDKAWSGTLGPSGSAGAASENIDQDFHYVQVFIDKADAAEDKIEGHVLTKVSGVLVPYQGEVVYQTLVYDAQGKDLGIRQYRPIADAEGNFTVNAPLSPFDYAIAGVYVWSDMDIYRGNTLPMRATVPYSIIDFVPDVFNNLVYGTVSGEYSGPLIVKIERPGKPMESIQTRANKGDFGVPVALNAGDKVNVLLNFEGMDIWARPEFVPAGLDSLRINIAPGMATESEGANEWDAKGLTAGSIQNTIDVTPYTGQVELKVDKVVGYGTDKPVKVHMFSESQTVSVLKDAGPESGEGKVVVPKAGGTPASLPLGPQTPTAAQNALGTGRPKNTKGISTFYFEDTPVYMRDREYSVTIEYKGIKKTEVFNHHVGDFTPYVSSHGFKSATASPNNSIFNPIGNPADTSGIASSAANAMNIPQDVLNRAFSLNAATAQQQQAAFAPSNMPTQGLALNASAGDGYVNLEWKPFVGDNIVGYNLYRGTSSKNYSDVPIKTLDKNDTKYTDKDVTNGTIYYYTIKAIFGDKTESVPANEVNAKPVAPAGPITPIKPPLPPIKPPVIPRT